MDLNTKTPPGLARTSATFDPQNVLELNFYCDTYGVDSISFANCVAFAMECYEEGILTSEHTGGLELKFGNGVPDSYGSRELGPQCRIKEHQVQTRRARVADINAARQWLVQQKWVAKSRISLIGWGNGAAALLWAVRPQMWSRNVEPDFRSAVAFYPDCGTSSGLGWSARVPTSWS